jgi:hypothetical protein
MKASMCSRSWATALKDAPCRTCLAGLVGIEVVENDVDSRVRLSSNDAVHKVEKFDASSPSFVSGHQLPGGHLEGGKQRRGAIALVVMAMAGQRPPAGKLEIACARSRAWIDGFSSTQMTTAFSGGAI